VARLLGVRFARTDLLTGLPEYRNGGLLLDTGLLTLKEADRERGEAAYREHMAATGARCMEIVPVFPPDDDVVVEWRAVTVGFLDEIHASVNVELGLLGDQRLSLAQVLEAGTWKVCWFTSGNEFGLLIGTGRTRDCGDVETKYQGTPYYARFRRHSVLGDMLFSFRGNGPLKTDNAMGLGGRS
jgi:hypothetical protein